jgi:hypothetical protein
MLLALILVGAVTLLLCWLLLTLAPLALPLFVGVAACHLAWQSGAGLMGSLLLGGLAGGATLFAGQFLLATLRGVASQAAIRLVFAAPAAIAGYSAGRGLAVIVGASPAWQLLLGAGAGFCVAAMAVGRLSAGLRHDGEETSCHRQMMGTPSAQP